MPDVGQTYKMPYRGVWRQWTDWDLKNKFTPAVAEQFMAKYRHFCANRISYYLPHCDGAEFINDVTSGICLLLKGNRLGGSSHGAAKLLVRNIRCDPTWMCFSREHGIKYQSFKGEGRRVLVATNSWNMMQDSIWPEIRKLLPREELEEYAEDYGNPVLYPEERDTRKRQNNMNFRSNKSCDLLLKRSKVLLCFRCYSQAQVEFESTFYDDAWEDEQCPEDKQDGIDERGRGRPGFQIWITTTLHKLPGKRANDTGKSSWIYKKLYMGTDTKGKKLRIYWLKIDGVPDAIYPAKDKAEAFEKHVTNPKLNRDKKAQRMGEARYYGLPEGDGDIVLDNYDGDTHLVPRFSVPDSWTRYRGIDHGRKRPCACLRGAMTPWGDMVFYSEYYEIGRTIAQNAMGIVKACGNERLLVDNRYDEDMGITLPIWEEQFKKESYYVSVMDARSFHIASNERECTIGQFYNDCGLNCQAAHPTRNSGNKEEMDDGIIGKMQAWLAVDPKRKHLMQQLWERQMIPRGDYDNWLKRRGGDTLNGARAYFMDDLRYFIMEITTWQDPNNRDADDHLISCFKYILAENPAYWGNDWANHEEIEERDEAANKWTGY